MTWSARAASSALADAAEASAARWSRAQSVCALAARVGDAFMAVWRRKTHVSVAQRAKHGSRLRRYTVSRKSKGHDVSVNEATSAPPAGETFRASARFMNGSQEGELLG
jgi:hypothetical protein